ncbi:MAG: DUF2752 domain-containing protein [Gemmatimonadota bacterium]
MWSLIAAAYALLGIGMARVSPGVLQLLPPCPFRSLTGFPCPTCGTSRALLALAHGAAAEAFRIQPLATLLVLAALAAGALSAAAAMTPRLRSAPEEDRRTLPAAAWRAPVAATDSPGRHTVLAVRALAIALSCNWAYLLIAAGGR